MVTRWDALHAIGIRKATEDRCGLRDASEGINGAGGNITAERPLARELEIGDRSTTTSVSSDLYRQMGASPIPVDLAVFWRQFGVNRARDRVTFDDRAPLAKYARA
jgi:hypothetical protein